ncbi:hypothetical protein B296_00034243 [Ensete ventricosum]|uniref:Uncharacterized protein n=1 Tax=Ensete ventricosum TaxID=4639 RepID=A0A426XE75_ENSVE|nr:hypothetical protein B296_00034243 [Ensete ventricosum]
MAVEGAVGLNMAGQGGTPVSSSLVNLFGAGAQMAVEGAVGLNMAGQGVTLVLRASWFNRSSWIRVKEITAIRVYGYCAFTSSQISGFRPSMKVEARVVAIVGIAWEVEVAEMATGQQECSSDTR